MTAAAATSARNVKRHRTARLTLRINDVDCGVVPMRDPNAPVAGFRLQNTKNDFIYCINSFGKCGCPEVQFCKVTCKLQRGMQSVELLED